MRHGKATRLYIDARIVGSNQRTRITTVQLPQDITIAVIDILPDGRLRIQYTEGTKCNATG